ncbi:MAG: hypothetical protein Q8O89_02895 [Nanoarchaeota archaeon]|nr:hypothetical protein [Nanoarchaeota archaeon]
MAWKIKKVQKNMKIISTETDFSHHKYISKEELKIYEKYLEKGISKEIKKRILQFDRQIKEIREKISNYVFDKPLRQVLK